MKTRLETYFSTQERNVLKLVTQVRFSHPLHRRSLQRDVQDTGMSMHLIGSIASLDGHGTGARPVQAGGTELNTGHAPHCRVRGQPWILPPDGQLIQSDDPLKASAGHRPERCQGPRKRHGARGEARIAAGRRLSRRNG